MKYIRLRHELTDARWDEKDAKWHLRIRMAVTVTDSKDSTGADGKHSESLGYEVFEDTADVLFLGTGLLSRWSWPDIEGLNSFKGKLMHSAQWDLHGEGQAWKEGVKDWEDKNVGVIGLVRHFLHIQTTG